MGVGDIIGSDRAMVTKIDTIDSSFFTSEIGEVREEVLARKIEGINSFVKYIPLRLDTLLEQEISTLPANLNLLVLCEDSFQPIHYAVINKLCLKNKLTWISYRSTGSGFEIGPTVVPRETACFKCYEARKLSNSTAYEEYIYNQGYLSSHHSTLGSLNITFGYDLLLLEIIRILTNFTRTVTYSSVVSFDLISLEVKTHPVLKLPRCPECSPLSQHRTTANVWQFEEALEHL